MDDYFLSSWLIKYCNHPTHSQIKNDRARKRGKKILPAHYHVNNKFHFCTIFNLTQKERLFPSMSNDGSASSYNACTSKESTTFMYGKMRNAYLCSSISVNMKQFITKNLNETTCTHTWIWGNVNIVFRKFRVYFIQLWTMLEL